MRGRRKGYSHPAASYERHGSYLQRERRLHEGVLVADELLRSAEGSESTLHLEQPRLEYGIQGSGDLDLIWRVLHRHRSDPRPPVLIVGVEVGILRADDIDFERAGGAVPGSEGPGVGMRRRLMMRRTRRRRTRDQHYYCSLGTVTAPPPSAHCSFPPMSKKLSVNVKIELCYFSV